MQSSFNHGADVTDTRIFYWLPANATVLYHKIQCIEDLGIQGAQRGIMELQPGRALSHHARGQGATPRCPSSFSIAIEEIGEVTPMFRYTLSVEERDVSGRKRKRLDDGLPPLAPIVPFAGVQSQVNGAEPMVTVSFCTEDGRHRAVARVPGYVCPLESCGMRCRDFKGLQHHLATSHLYYECGSFMGSAGPQIYIRCKKGEGPKPRIPPSALASMHTCLPCFLARSIVLCEQSLLSHRP